MTHAKPLIAKADEGWCCVSQLGIGFGPTPKAAYCDYQRDEKHIAWLQSDEFLRTPLVRALRVLAAA